ncbi:MAG: helix-turn-helix domain-containing protein [Pseudomonadota bacterium]
MSEDIPAFQPENTSLQSAGQRLRSARETLGLSLKDAAQRTQQSTELLRALEEMRTDTFSSTVLRMHARTYADALGLPQDDIAAAFAPARSQLQSERMPGAPQSAKSDTSLQFAVPAMSVAGLVALLFVVMMLWPSSNSMITAAPVSSKVERATRTIDEPTRFRADLTGPELQVVALRSGVIEVRGSDGTIFRNREMRAGEVYFPRVGAGWTITVQDAGAFEWRLEDISIGPMGEADTPVYAVPVDDAMQRGLQLISEAIADAELREEPQR